MDGLIRIFHGLFPLRVNFLELIEMDNLKYRVAELEAKLRTYELESLPDNPVYCPTCKVMRHPSELYKVFISMICCSECGEAVERNYCRQVKRNH